MTRNIGIPITVPKKECTDKHCPFHGILSVRGKLFEGKVVSAKAKNTIVLQKESLVYFTKFKRYARSKSKLEGKKPKSTPKETKPEKTKETKPEKTKTNSKEVKN